MSVSPSVEAATAEAGQGVAESDGTTLATLVQGAMVLLRAQGSLIARLHDGAFVVDAAAGTLAALLGTRHSAASAIFASLAISENHCLISNEVGLDTRIDQERAGRFGIREAVAAPWRADDVRGVLLAVNSDRGGFLESDAAALAHFALLGALALRHEATATELGRRNFRLESVARLQQAMARTGLGDVYGEVYRAVISSVPDVPCFAILLADVDRQVFVPQFLASDGVITTAEAMSEVPMGSCAATRAYLSGTPVRELRPEVNWAHRLLNLASARVPRDELAVPLAHGDEIRGVLLLQSFNANAYQEDDANLLAIIGGHAAAAIYNARLFEAQVRERELAEAAGAIARAALAVTSLPLAATDIIGIIGRLVPAGGLALGVVCDDDRQLHYVAAVGSCATLRDLRLPVTDSVARFVPGDTPLWLADLAPTGARELTQIQQANCYVAPLVEKNRVMGVLVVDIPGASSRVRPDVQALARLAPSVALAIDVFLLADEDRRRRDRERMLATALATMDQPVFVLGLDRRVLYANAAAAREYAYDIDEFVTLQFETLVASAVPARRLGAGDATSGSVWMAEHVHRRRDGSTFPASVLLSYIRDEAGVPVGQVLNVRSLLEERRLEEQLRQSEKLAAIGELVAGVAHELNNPLTGISAFAQLMLDEQLTEEQHESVRLIKREADRAVGVIRDLLLFARKTGPKHATLNLNELIELTLRLRAYALRTSGVNLVTQLDEGAPHIHGDSLKLQQVFLNLIVNAEHALQKAQVKRLSISTHGTSDGVTVVVADTGVGMSEETRQRIFEPFFTTKPAGHGTGLGLSVSYGIIRSHGGSIMVGSEPGRGTTFTLVFPVSHAGAQAADVHV